MAHQVIFAALGERRRESKDGETANKEPNLDFQTKQIINLLGHISEYLVVQVRNRLTNLVKLTMSTQVVRLSRHMIGKSG